MWWPRLFTQRKDGSSTETQDLGDSIFGYPTTGAGAEWRPSGSENSWSLFSYNLENGQCVVAPTNIYTKLLLMELYALDLDGLGSCRCNFQFYETHICIRARQDFPHLPQVSVLNHVLARTGWYVCCCLWMFLVRLTGGWQATKIVNTGSLDW
jgi:hypothetical protein